MLEKYLATELPNIICAKYTMSGLSLCIFVCSVCLLGLNQSDFNFTLSLSLSLSHTHIFTRKTKVKNEHPLFRYKDIRGYIANIQISLV